MNITTGQARTKRCSWGGIRSRMEQSFLTWTWIQDVIALASLHDHFWHKVSQGFVTPKTAGSHSWTCWTESLQSPLEAALSLSSFNTGPLRSLSMIRNILTEKNPHKLHHILDFDLKSRPCSTHVSLWISCVTDSTADSIRISFCLPNPILKTTICRMIMLTGSMSKRSPNLSKRVNFSFGSLMNA